eukprot:bmy_12221T0
MCMTMPWKKDLQRKQRELGQKTQPFGRAEEPFVAARRTEQATNHHAATLYINPQPAAPGTRRSDSLRKMSETAPVAPAVPAPPEKTPVKKKTKKTGAAAGKRKASGPPVSELITKAVAASKERSGVWSVNHSGKNPGLEKLNRSTLKDGKYQAGACATSYQFRNSEEFVTSTRREYRFNTE